MSRFYNVTLAQLVAIKAILISLPVLGYAQDLEENRFMVSVKYDSDVGRNVFSLDTISNENLYVQRGSTLVFDISDETLQNHPLRLSGTQDGIHSGGVKIETTTISANLALSTGTDTPGQLFLYCENHSGMGRNISLTVSGSTTDLFLSDFNSTTEKIYIPRVHVLGKRPRIFSLQLGLSSDLNVLNLISATEGRISEFAQPDRRQATYDVQTSTLWVPALLAIDKMFSATFSVESPQIKLTKLLPLKENLITDGFDYDPATDIESSAGSELNPELRKDPTHPTTHSNGSHPSVTGVSKGDSKY